KRDGWGQKRRADRPSIAWLAIPAAQLRIVPDDLWDAAHDRLTTRRANYARWNAAGKPPGALTDGRGVRAQYFLAGFARCNCCGGSMQVVSRESTTGRLRRYVCSSYWNR